MRNLSQHPIEFSDLIDAIETSEVAIQDLVGSCHPTCLQYISEYLISNRFDVEQFLESKKL